MKDLWTVLKETDKPIVLYGMGNGADKIISVLNRYDIKISGVFASDGFVRPKVFHGFAVTDYKTAKETFGDMVVLVCFGSSLPDVIANIKRIAEEQKKAQEAAESANGAQGAQQIVEENGENG